MPKPATAALREARRKHARVIRRIRVSQEELIRLPAGTRIEYTNPKTKEWQVKGVVAREAYFEPFGLMVDWEDGQLGVVLPEEAYLVRVLIE